MSVMAVTFPILPGKTPEWRTWMNELNGARHEEFAASRSRAGVHERTFLQQTPAGDVVIVTLEGKDPQRSFAEMTTGSDAFTTWFVKKAREVHGIDVSAPLNGSSSRLVADSDSEVAPT